jgi:hypothetical protein
MSPLSSEQIRKWGSQIRTDEPLPANDPRYVQFFEPGTTAVDEIVSGIKDGDQTRGSVHLLSGPRGSGKTTEFQRLKHELESEGLTVFVVDILDYVNPSSPLDITQFLTAFGLAFTDQVTAVKPDLLESISGDGGFRSRFSNFLKRLDVKLNLGGAEIRASADGVGAGFAGQSLSIDLKRELKGSEAFADELRNRLSFHLGELRREVEDFCKELAGQLSDLPVVFVLDSMEKFRGTTATDADVQSSIEALFVHHTDKLVFDGLHVIYTVPPILRIRNPAFATHIGAGSIGLVTTPKVCDRRGAQVDNDSLAKFREMLNKRLPTAQLFANESAVDRLIMMSGGNLRDLLRLASQVLVKASARRLDAPLPDEVAELAISTLQQNYRFAVEDREFLKQVQHDKGIDRLSESDFARFARLLDTEVILGHINGTEWFEVHPLALDAIQLLQPGS